MSSKDNDEELVMHSKSDIIENMIDDKADEVIEDLFQLLHSRYQIGYHLSNYKCYKIKQEDNSKSH